MNVSKDIRARHDIELCGQPRAAHILDGQEARCNRQSLCPRKCRNVVRGVNAGAFEAQVPQPLHENAVVATELKHSRAPGQESSEPLLEADEMPHQGWNG